MKVLEPGHCYELNVIDDKRTACFVIPQKLLFVERVGAKYPGNKSAHAGTTSQEVLRALIDRAIYVNKQIPCWQTWLGTQLMAITVWLFEHRAAKKHGRKAPSISNAVLGEFCEFCGHVGCRGGCR